MRSAVDIARQMSRIESRLADEPDNGKLHAQRRIAERQLELRLELEAYSRPGDRIRPPILTRFHLALYLDVASRASAATSVASGRGVQ